MEVNERELNEDVYWWRTGTGYLQYSIPRTYNIPSRSSIPSAHSVLDAGIDGIDAGIDAGIGEVEVERYPSINSINSSIKNTVRTWNA